MEFGLRILSTAQLQPNRLTTQRTRLWSSQPGSPAADYEGRQYTHNDTGVYCQNERIAPVGEPARTT